jgi:uncharacterized protein (TIGR04255 family)
MTYASVTAPQPLTVREAPTLRRTALYILTTPCAPPPPSTSAARCNALEMLHPSSMAEHRHLSSAPIVEALVDLRALLPDDFDVSRFEALKDQLRDRFPGVQPLFEQRMTVAGAPGQPVSSTTSIRVNGFAFRSEDGKTLVQFRRDGFTFNRLRPYTSWEEIRPEALELWTIYRRVAKPPPCSRIALRYVNQLDVTESDAALTDILTAVPGVPRDTPRLLNEFFMRVVLADPATGFTAAITQATQASPAANVGLILLDIDAYRAGSGGIPDREVEPTLEALHKLKNDIFFGSITEATARRYA